MRIEVSFRSKMHGEAVDGKLPGPADSTIDSSQPGSERTPRTAAIGWLFPGRGTTVSLLPHATHVIGRDSGCAVRLDSPSVSRRHAEIYRQGPIFVVKDLGSHNGTYVDGVRVTHTPIRRGQLLRIGDHIGILGSEGSLETPRVLQPLAFGRGLVGGPVLRTVLDRLRRAAAHDLPIIVQGETGTGKELVAQSVHVWSGRSGPLHAVNCAVLVPSLADAELFGYRKGAFTGAVQGHVGHFRAAHGGTLFLDEVSELALESQAKLLRVLERSEVLPLGETQAVKVDVRLICACQSDLSSAVERGTFRADLRARLAGYTCVLPPLRERREDVPALFAGFLERYSGGHPPRVSPKLIEKLCLYAWPDNVRELELLTRSLLALHGDEELLRPELLPGPLADKASTRHDMKRSRSHAEPPVDRRSYELKELASALHRAGGNVSRAAQELGLSRQRVYRLIDHRSIAEFVSAYHSDGAG